MELPEYCCWGALSKGALGCEQSSVGAAARLEVVDASPQDLGAVVYAVCGAHLASAAHAGEFMMAAGPEDVVALMGGLERDYPGRVWVVQREAA